MLTWKEETLIHAPIDTVWSLFEIENMPIIMPNVLSTEILEAKEGVVGSTYLQTYKEGKKTMQYVVTDLAHVDTESYKHNQSTFTLANMFQITVSYSLYQKEQDTTLLVYEGTNVGIKWWSKCMLTLMPKKANDTVVADFLSRVTTEAETK